MRRLTAACIASTACVALAACEQPPKQNETTTTPANAAAKPAAPKLDRVDRTELNRLAAELFLPIFWVEDKDKNNAISPDELAVLWGMKETSRAEWVANNQFTPAFMEAYERIAKLKADGHSFQGLDENETKRRKAVLKELGQGKPTILLTDLTNGSEEDKAITKNIVEAARTIEKIFAMQRGSAGMAEQIPADDTASKTLFYRNQAPWCVAPETEMDPDCNALASRPKKISGLYPESIQKDDPKFCAALEKRKDAESLLHQFHVVREDEGGKLKPVPYNEVYKAEMESISKNLQAAADAVKSPEEAAFKAYLTEAAKSFLTNDWEPADEAWAKMNSQNSKWYLRIGPDETYFEPCARHGGFHVSFARINQASVEWQAKLDPIKNDMEQALAAVAGKPYKARKVSFHLPDFIDVIVNAGDSRDEHGATVGQALPNWGPVASQGRGRTVAMTNFYTDADSKAQLRAQVESLYCAGSMAAFTEDQAPGLMTVVLHEATHNLGPMLHEYKVNGKTDDAAFGGSLAAMMEELKSEVAADFFADWLLERGAVTKDVVEKTHTRSVSWMMSHISRGVRTNDGKIRPYSMLAAIEWGYLIKDGAIVWNADELAANKQDKGCAQLQLDKFPATFKKMMATVGGIKAKNDKKGAEDLIKDLVEKEGMTKELLDTIKTRWLRAPKQSFVYSVEY